MANPIAINVTAVWEPNAAGKCRWVCRYAGVIGTAFMHPQLAASRLAHRLGLRHSRVHVQGSFPPAFGRPAEHFFKISGVAV